MHLAPVEAQRVHVRQLALDLLVDPSETIWTEISCKYTRESAGAALAEAGLRLERWFTDAEQLFAVALATRAA